jgi:hypothetical protein
MRNTQGSKNQGIQIQEFKPHPRPSNEISEVNQDAETSEILKWNREGYAREITIVWKVEGQKSLEKE